MTGYNCPAEGCDYGDGSDEKSKAAVRAHINSSGRGGHDYENLKADLDAQDPDETANQDQDGNQSEPAGNGESDTSDQSDPPSPGEQWDASDDRDGQPDDQTEGGIPLPMDATHLLLIAVALIVLLWYLNRDTDTAETAEPASDPDETEDPNGGLEAVPGATA